MDFDDILNQWNQSEKINEKTKTVKNNKDENNSMSIYLDQYSPDTSTIQSKEEIKKKSSGKKNKNKKADFILDLHGLTADEAKERLHGFIQHCCRIGAIKILIIHGKGNHTKGRAVLKPLVRSILETSPYIGDVGTAERRDGGSGATWALIRQRSL